MRAALQTLDADNLTYNKFVFIGTNFESYYYESNKKQPNTIMYICYLLSVQSIIYCSIIYFVDSQIVRGGIMLFVKSNTSNLYFAKLNLNSPFTKSQYFLLGKY